MDAQTAVEILRSVNVALGVVCLIWLLIRTANRWSDYPREVRWALRALIAGAISATFASAEQVGTHAPPGFRAVFTFVFLATLLAMLAVTQRRREIAIRHGHHGVHDANCSGC